MMIDVFMGAACLLLITVADWLLDMNEFPQG